MMVLSYVHLIIYTHYMLTNLVNHKFCEPTIETRLMPAAVLT